MLNPQAETFFRALPPEAYPRATIESYPRIANRIVELHDNKEALTQYFESLISDDRGGRQGFSFAVLSEIQSLFDRLVGIPGGFMDTGKWLASLDK